MPKCGKSATQKKPEKNIQQNSLCLSVQIIHRPNGKANLGRLNTELARHVVLPQTPAAQDLAPAELDVLEGRCATKPGVRGRV